jgi:hypothetical protein
MLTNWYYLCLLGKVKGDFFGFFSFFMYDIQHCFICRPSDSTVSEDAGIETRTVATTALAVRHSNHSAIDIIHTRLDHLLGKVGHSLVNSNVRD